MVGRVHKVHERVFSFCVGTHKYLVLWIVFVPKMIPTHQHIYTLTHTDTQFIFMLTLKWECHLVCRFVFISLFNLVLLLVLRGHREKERVRERERAACRHCCSRQVIYTYVYIYIKWNLLGFAAVAVVGIHHALLCVLFLCALFTFHKCLMRSQINEMKWIDVKWKARAFCIHSHNTHTHARTLQSNSMCSKLKTKISE